MENNPADQPLAQQHPIHVDQAEEPEYQPTEEERELPNRLGSPEWNELGPKDYYGLLHRLNNIKGDLLDREDEIESLKKKSQKQEKEISRLEGENSVLREFQKSNKSLVTEVLTISSSSVAAAQRVPSIKRKINQYPAGLCWHCCDKGINIPYQECVEHHKKKKVKNN